MVRVRPEQSWPRSMSSRYTYHPGRYRQLATRWSSTSGYGADWVIRAGSVAFPSTATATSSSSVVGSRPQLDDAQHGQGEQQHHADALDHQVNPVGVLHGILR